MNNGAQEAFGNIYNNKTWTGHWATTDGYGSTLEYTVTIRETLPPLLKKYNIKSMLDASCGEFTWMREVYLTGIRYVGGEIVEDKINKLKLDFPQHEWLHLDIIEDKLPDVDLWMCRDTIFHFPHQYVKQTLKNFVNSNIKYLLISSHPEADNIDINSFGDFNFINFDRAPFNFPAPIDMIDDTEPGFPLKRNMHLYRREDLAKFEYLND